MRWLAPLPCLLPGVGPSRTGDMHLLVRKSAGAAAAPGVGSLPDRSDLTDSSSARGILSACAEAGSPHQARSHINNWATSLTSRRPLLLYVSILLQLVLLNLTAIPPLLNFNPQHHILLL